MIPGTNATIVDGTLSDATDKSELKQIELELDDAFLLYKPSIAWLYKTVDLLKKYKLLSGKEYEIKNLEDSII